MEIKRMSFEQDGKLIALSMGNKRHWWGGTEYVIEELCVASEEQGSGN